MSPKTLCLIARPDTTIRDYLNPKGERRSWTLAELLPDSFTGKELP